MAGPGLADEMPDKYRPLIVNIGVLSNVSAYQVFRDGHAEFGYGTSKVPDKDPRYSQLGKISVSIRVELKGKGPAMFSEMVGVFAPSMDTRAAVSLGDEGFLGTNQKGWIRQYIVRVGDNVVLVSSWGTTDPRLVLNPILAALKGAQPLSSQEVAFRNLLFPALGFAGDTARSCLDEVMNWAEAQTDDTTRDQIAQLRKAGTAARTVEVLAADAARPEDFDSQWWDALREVAPDPSKPGDPVETATDFLIDLLPPPINTLVNIGRNTHKGLQAAKTHITDPKVRGEIYACYRREHFGKVFGNGASTSAYEDELSQNLANASVCGKAGEMFKAGYEKQLKGLSVEGREREFRRLITPVAIRFEYIYRVEDARANRTARLAAAWTPVQGILDRLKTRVNVCIAKPR